MTATNQPIDLNPTHLETIQCILNEHVPDCEVRAFGSRAKWNARDYSDLDLAVVGQEPQNWRVLNQLETAFRESDLPFKVDVLDWHDISDKFQKIIQDDCITIRPRRINLKSCNDRIEQQPLGELANNFDSRRVPLSKRERASKSGPYPYYGATGIMDHVDDFLFEGLHLLVAEDGSVETKEGFPFLQLVDGKFWVNNHAHVLQGHDDEETKYLYYALSTIPIRPFISGSVQAKLSQSNLKRITIPYPNKQTRTAITHILGTLDDKIELNRRMNETLEAMAQALFKSWFVDFDPVRAKMEGRWQPGESLPGLPAHLYDLFPDRLVPSELGEIPEGWDVKPLTDCFNLTMGQSPPGDTYNDKVIGLPFFQGSTDFNLRYPKVTRYCSEPQRTAQLGDTLVSVRAPVGAVNMAWEECCIGRGLASLKHKSNTYSFTYYSILNLKPQLQQFEHTGTVFGAITKQQFGSMKYVEPISKVIQYFESSVKDIDNQAYKATAESAVLNTCRDTILPYLYKGT